MYSGPALESVFSQVPLSDSDKEEKEEFSLYVALRHQHYPVLYVRPARVEDSDDLMPIFQQCSERIAQLYGKYPETLAGTAIPVSGYSSLQETTLLLS